MITVCPNCLQHLTVTPGDLRQGQGSVRCGRCSAIFNGLAALLDEPAEAVAGDRERPRTSRGRTLRRPRTAQRPAPPPAAANPAPQPPAPPPGAMAPAPATAPAGASSEVDAKLQALVARFEMVREFDRYASRRMTQMAPAPAPEPVPAPAPAPEPVPAPAPAPVPAPLPPPVPAPDPLDEELPPPETPRSHGRTLLHSVIAAVLLLLLAGQILHHFRSALLAHPQTRDSVLTVYGGLGLDPALQDDPKLYIVKQLGALAKPDSPRILLRTSIHNPADHPLPLPVLRTRLTDRFGAVLVQADVAPREYLGGRQGNALAPDQRLDTLLDLPDPGPAATSFEVDACLPGATGRLHCANSTGR